MSTAKGELLFVYGTLKRGQPNYDVMTDSTNGTANFVCCCQTVDKYPLVIATAANIPFLLLQKKGEGHVSMISVLKKMELFKKDHISLPKKSKFSPQISHIALLQIKK